MKIVSSIKYINLHILKTSTEYLDATQDSFIVGTILQYLFSFDIFYQNVKVLVFKSFFVYISFSSFFGFLFV